MVKMSLLGPFCLGSLLILFIEGTNSHEGRVVQLSRDKRDVDMLVACDEHCLPEDEIKDYDILLQYDEDPDPTPGPFLYDFKRKSCAFPCKIVDLNQTKGLNDILGGEFTIMSVDELPNENGDETSRVSNYKPFTTMVGLRKNVTFSPSVSKNVTTKSKLLNETSTCFCTNNNTRTNETTTSTSKLVVENTTKSVINHNKSSVFVNDTQENEDFTKINKVVISESTTQNQQFSVIPVIPKVIRYTIVEAEMAEAGGTALPKVEKTQVNNYFDDSNNASLVLNSLLETLAKNGAQGSKGILESFGLGHLSQDNENPLNYNFTSNTLSPKDIRMTDEVKVSKQFPSQELTIGTIESSTKNYVVTHPIRNKSENTETKLNKLNQSSLNNETKILQTNNITHLFNETLSKDDTGKATSDTFAKLPLGSEKSSNSRNEPDELKQNLTYLNSSGSSSSHLKETDLHKLSSANLTSPNNSTGFHNESFSLDKLKRPNITDHIYGELSNISNPSPPLSQDLQVFPSTGLANMTDFSMHNNKTFGNNSYSPPSLLHEANNTDATLNKTTSLHKIQ